jgi:hypothetical protein
VNLAAGKLMERSGVTSNLAAAVSTADLLIALAQMPEVKGAAWHGLNAGPWQLFDASTQHNDLRPRPVYWGLRVLRAIDLPIVLRTATSSPNLGKYAGGYDVRAVALTNTERDVLGLWLVNRAWSNTTVELRVASWMDRPVTIQHYYVAGEAGRDPDDPRMTPKIELKPKPVCDEFSGSGTIQLELPPSSVSSFLITGASPAARLEVATVRDSGPRCSN